MSKNRTALVTGAEGFVGAKLVAFLRTQGWTVFAGNQVLPSADSSPSFNLACDVVNFRQVQEVLSLVQPTHLFHLAAESLPIASWNNPVRVFQSNILGSLHVFEAVRALKKPPLVISACSSAEYGCVPISRAPVKEDHPLVPVNPYGLSKVCLDFLSGAYAHHHRIPAVTLRLFNTTGPCKNGDAPSDFLKQLVRIKRKEQPPRIEVGNLKSRRAFLHVDDAVRAFYLAAVRGRIGQVYNVCADRAVSMRALLHLAIRLAGVKATIVPLKRLSRPVDEPIIWGDCRKFKKATGWKPSFSLEQILADMLSYWDSQQELTARPQRSTKPSHDSPF